MNIPIHKLLLYFLLVATLLSTGYLLLTEPFESPKQSKKLVIHTSMDVYLINIDSMTVEMGSTDSVYRFNDFVLLAKFVMNRTREEVSEQRSYYLELNKQYNDTRKTKDIPR